MMKIRRPAIRYHGSKWRLALAVIANMPPHKVYVEPFGGGGSVLLRKDRVAAEIYNDLDGRVVQVFRVLRCPDKAKLVARRLSLTPYAREEFDSCYESTDDEIEQVCRTIMLSFMGHGTDSITSSCRTGFLIKMTDTRATPAAPWGDYWKLVSDFTERLRGVVIENRDATDVMVRMDSPRTLFFVDPPYVTATRSSIQGRGSATHGYKHEMNDEAHRDLSDVLHSLKGMVMLSGYPSELYNTLYPDWHSISFDSLADGAKKRTEVLWFNPAAWAARPQPKLEMEAKR